MLKPTETTRPTRPQAESPGQRQLKHPPDDRSALLNQLARSSRGVNTADPAIEDPSVSFPPSIQVDSYRSNGRGALEKAEGGTALGR